MNLNDRIASIRNFFHVKLWSVKHDELPWKTRQLYIFLKIWFITIAEFNKDRIREKASNLTYFTLLSIVPVIAMAFGISKGFGLEKIMEKQISSFFAGQQEIQKNIMSIAQNMIQAANGNVITGVGLVVLLYLVMRLLNHIEITFNVMWDIKKHRPIHRKLSDYISVMVLGVLLVVLSSSATYYILTEVDKLGSTQAYSEIKSGVVFLIKLIPYSLIWLLLFLLYLIFPNTRVKVRAALIAGIVAGSAYQLTQWGFITFNFLFSRYNAIYGSLAILPLFLIYIQLSWFIVLIGAELAYAIQHYNTWIPDGDNLKLSLRHRRKMALIIMYRIIRQFEQAKNPISIAQLSAKGSVPTRFIAEICFELEKARLINRIESEKGEEFFQPAYDIQQMSIQSVLNQYESYGSEDFDNIKSDAFVQLEKCLDQMNHQSEKSKQNLLIKNLV